MMNKPGSPVLSHLVRWWTARRGDLKYFLHDLTPEQLAWRPLPDEWSILERARHVAATANGYLCGALSGKVFDWDQAIEWSGNDLESLLKDLNRVHEGCLRVLESLDDTRLEEQFIMPWGDTIPLRGVLEHLIEHEPYHTGQVAILRSYLKATLQSA